LEAHEYLACRFLLLALLLAPLLDSHRVMPTHRTSSSILYNQKAIESFECDIS